MDCFTLCSKVNTIQKIMKFHLIYVVVSGGHLRICELLMKEGASAVASSADGGTPLHYLVRIPWDPVHSPKVFSPLLIKQMGDVNSILNQQEESPLHQGI